MADGEIIAYGTPEQVRATPAVVEAYLGGSIEAIERSGPLAKTPTQDVDLATVLGVGRNRADALLRHFHTIDAVRNASVQALQEVPGVGAVTAKLITERLR
jgi:hypothetical protein